MSGNLGQLVVEISGNVSKLTEATTKAQYETQKMADKIGRDVNGINNHFERMGAALSKATSLMGGLGLAASIGALVAFEKRIINTADELSKMSQRVGVSVENLSALTYAGELSDVSMESLGKGLKQLSKNMFDALRGSREQEAAFLALGISVDELKSGLTDSYPAFVKVAEQFKNLPDSAEKTALSMKVFGKAGADLIPLLNSGASGLEDMRIEAEKLGVVIDENTAKAAEKFNDDLTRLTTATKGWAFSLAEEVLPALTQVSEGMNKISFAEGFWEKLKELQNLGLRRGLGQFMPEGEQFKLGIHSATKSEITRISQETDAGKASSALQKYIDSINSDSKAANKAITLQEKWNITLADLKNKVEAANPSIDEFQKKMAALSIDEKKLFDQKGAAQHAKEIKESFDKLREFEGNEILGKAMAGAFKKLEEQLKPIVGPLDEINASLEQQKYLLGFLGDQQEVENKIMQIRNQLLSQGRALMLDEEEAIRGNIKLVQQLNDENRVANILMQNSQSAKDKAFSLTLAGIDSQFKDPTSGFTKSDATLEAVNAAGLGREFGNTKDAYTLRYEQLKNYYKKINDLRERDYISEQAAQQMKAQLEFDLNAEKLQFAGDFFSNMASMAESSNKELAAIGKAAAITQATIDGILAVQKALAAYSPPYNYIAAAAVGVTAAANVAKIAGFEEGGYTGDMGRKQVAGVVHGQEFVVNASATAKNRAALETINKGGSIGGMNVTIQNYGTSKGFEVEQLSAGDVRIIARDEIRTHAPKTIAGEIANPNSTVSKSLDRNTKIQRKRAS